MYVLATYLTDHAVSSAERRVNFGANTDQTSRNCKHQVIFLSKERNNSRTDGLTCQFSVVILGDKTRSDFDFLANFKNSFEDRTTRNSTLRKKG